MPELAEVRKMTKDLQERIEGKRMKTVELCPTGKYRPDKEGPPPRFEDFIGKFPQTVTCVRPKGKKTIIEFETVYIIMGYGMTGSLDAQPTEHLMFTFLMEDNTRWYYNDERTLGNLHVFANKPDFDAGERQYAKGMDPLETPLSLGDWVRLVRNPRRKKTNIVKFLRDQQAIGGIGNYLSAEILLEARLSPERTLETLLDRDIKRLKEATDLKIKEAQDANGNTFEDEKYHDMSGGKGTFVCKVYSTSYYEGHEVKAKRFFGKQWTYWCPYYQK